MRVRSFGMEGLVPASYVEILASSPAPQSPFDNPRPSFADHRMSTASVSTTSLAGSISSSAPSVKKKGPAVAPKRGGKKLKYVEAMYTYSASGEGEVSMDEGEKLVLIAPDTGDGWCEVERSGGGGRGVVPAGWVREA